MQAWPAGACESAWYPHARLHAQIESGEFTDSEIIIMLGENGTGKTTFIRMLAGMAPPDEGSSQEGEEMPSFHVRCGGGAGAVVAAQACALLWRAQNASNCLQTGFYSRRTWTGTRVLAQSTMQGAE